MIDLIKMVKILITKVGDPFSKESEQGPQVDGEQQEKVLYFIFSAAGALVVRLSLLRYSSLQSSHPFRIFAPKPIKQCMQFKQYYN